MEMARNMDEKLESCGQIGRPSGTAHRSGPRLLQKPQFLHRAQWEICWHQQDWEKMTFTLAFGSTSEGMSGIK